jgi:Ca-activated chloride channel family protein
MVSLAHPWYLPAGILACLLLWLWWRQMERRRQRMLARFAAPSLLYTLTASICPLRRAAKKLLVAGAVFCCFVALAEPRYGSRWIDVKHKGIDILFALDSSRSMLAPDVRPSRLERSKLAVMDFVGRLQGDRVGLLPFAGTSHLLCPLTADYQAFNQSLQAVDSTLLPVGGTDIGGAIKAAEAVLANDANHKLLVIITDGEDLGMDGVATARAAHSRGMTIFTIGVGTAAGELIPDRASGGFVKDNSGAYVRSRLDRQALKAIAEQGGGIYADLGNRGEGLDTVYRERLALVPAREFAEKRTKVPISRSEWPLALAIVLLCGDFLLSGRKRQRSFHRAVARLARLRKPSIFALLLAAGLGLLGPPPAGASDGERAFADGDYHRAEAFYRELLRDDPDNPVLLFNTGSSAYKNERFTEAVDAFQSAIPAADPDLQEKAYFNQGNAWYRIGEKTRQSEVQKTVEAWQNALDAFAAALALNPENRDAAVNHDFVKEQLERLQQETETAPKSPEKEDREPSDEQAEAPQQPPQDRQATPDEPATPDRPGDTTGNAGDAGDANNGGKDSEPDQSVSGQSTAPAEQSDGITDQDRLDDGHTTGQTVEQGDDRHHSGNTGQTMTTEEAKRLLQAIEGEEGRLDLVVPQQPTTSNETMNDW